MFRKQVGAEVFADLVRIFPAGNESPRHDVFKSFLPLNDPRITDIVDRLAKAGFRPRTNRFEMLNRERQYWLDLDREYDDADLKHCEYLQLMPPPGGVQL